MSGHIGIVAATAEGAALCYRAICLEGPALLGERPHPEVSLHNHPWSKYAERLADGDWRGVAELMLSSAHKLAAAGADLLVCPVNTIHVAMPLVAPTSPLPWLHIAEVVAGEAAARGFRKIGVLGTRKLVESDVYPTALKARGLEFVRTETAERDELDRLIMTELADGVFRPGQLETLARFIGRLEMAGADAVALACTEIPLVLGERDSPLPTLDSTRLLARAAVLKAAGNAQG